MNARHMFIKDKIFKLCLQIFKICNKMMKIYKSNLFQIL